uniref:Large ribosomal subunit protein mL38 n=1 Tax=Macrostomum lignano TaxID=282301 RepID=A0A1I8JQF6_9PLAT
MMGPYDPRTPEDEEPGVKVRVKQEVPEEAKLSFRQRMAEWRARHHPEPPACNIGLPRSLLTASRPEPPDEKRQQELERLARNQQLRVDLDAVELAWESERRPEHALSAARHYSIMEHLFGTGCFFYPVVPLRAHFADPDLPGRVRPIALGNVMTPRQCSEAPDLRAGRSRRISTAASSGQQQQLKLGVAEREYAHWLVTDIPGSGRVAERPRPPPYLQPIPPLGTGLHRYALVLFVQSAPLEDQQENQQLPETDWLSATSAPLSSTGHQERLTPAASASSRPPGTRRCGPSSRHRLTDMGAEPVFEFRWPAPYRPKMQQFAFSEPSSGAHLNRPAERATWTSTGTSKDIAEETLKEKLKSVHRSVAAAGAESKYPPGAATSCSSHGRHLGRTKPNPGGRRPSLIPLSVAAEDGQVEGEDEDESKSEKSRALRDSAEAGGAAAKNLTAEELRKLQEESDLLITKDTFGFNEAAAAAGIIPERSHRPAAAERKEDFDKLALAALQKLRSLETSPHYRDSLKGVYRECALELDPRPKKAKGTVKVERDPAALDGEGTTIYDDFDDF